MGGTIVAQSLNTYGLRFIQEKEAALFATWEAAERPYPWTENQFEETRRPTSPIRTVVFETNASVLGFAALQVFDREAYLSNFMVAPDRRRKGLGLDLLQKVMMWAASEGATEMALDVQATNLPAIGLYQKCGFEIVQRRKTSFPRGEEGLVMRKEL